VSLDALNKNDDFQKKVDQKMQRKIKHLGRNKKSAWSGLGLFGIVGWSVMIPTIGGVIFGVWLDEKFPQSFSWTISFLMIGIAVGCIVAWKWVEKENKEMNENNE
jgi:ATP synthase protein I